MAKHSCVLLLALGFSLCFSTQVLGLSPRLSLDLSSSLSPQLIFKQTPNLPTWELEACIIDNHSKIIMGESDQHHLHPNRVALGVESSLAELGSINKAQYIKKKVQEHELSILETVIKSDQDKCQYRYLVLPNGLHALLVSEETLDKSSAALDVHVGNFYDPPDIPGLAHFLEHLLFLGTSKYPDENDYGNFLSSHGGHSNAFTSEEHTNYFFDVAADHLEGALDRFAQFFIAPLFNPSGTDRELLAVDSEHKKNLRNDHWRINQLEKSLSNEHHPYSHFGTGSLATLRDGPKSRNQDIRAILLDFYKQHYSANLMRLVVYGREGLDELERMVVEKFSAIPNRHRNIMAWPGKPLDGRHLGKFIQVRTIKELRSLYLIWQLPGLKEHRLSKPEHYFTHLLGHEGKGSILSLLKSHGWATGLGAGTDTDASGYAFLQVSIDLSPEGENHLNEIVQIVFQYLEMLRRVGPQPWVFKENQKLEQIAFRFTEKGSPSTFTYKTAGNMHYYPPELALMGPRVSLKYNEDALKIVLDALRPENFRLMFASPAPISDGVLHERWYDTEYSVRDLDAELLRFISSPPPNLDLSLPQPNAFIPDTLTAKLKASANPTMHPQLILQEGRNKLWHKQDDMFEMPKGCFQFLLMTPVAFSSARDFVRTYIFIEVLRDSLTETLYEAEVAGLHVEIGQTTDGVFLSFRGYDEKLPLLLEDIMKRVVAFRADPQKFAIHKDKYMRWLKSVIHDTPSSLISYYLNGLQLERHHWYWEKISELETLGIDEVDEIAELIVNGNVAIEALCHGNYRAEEAQSIFNTLQTVLASRKNIKVLLPAMAVRTISFSPGQDIIFSPEPIPNVNSAIEFYLQIGSLGDLRLRTLTLLFAQIFHEPFFDLLRTQEQLGYVVRHQSWEKGPSIGLRFVIQSERDPIFLDRRIEAFIEHVPKHLAKMSEQDFDAHVAALSSRLLAKKRSMSDETRVYWNQILLHQYEFERVYSDAAYLGHFKLSDLQAFVDEYIVKEGPKRRKFAIHLWSESVSTDRKSIYKAMLQESPHIQFFQNPHDMIKTVGLFPLNYNNEDIQEALQQIKDSNYSSESSS